MNSEPLTNEGSSLRDIYVSERLRAVVGVAGLIAQVENERVLDTTTLIADCFHGGYHFIAELHRYEEQLSWCITALKTNLVTQDLFLDHLEALASGETRLPALMIYAQGTVATAYHLGYQPGFLLAVESTNAQHPEQVLAQGQIKRITTTPEIVEFFLGEDTTERLSAIVHLT